jgi:hypothetical protein
LTRVDVFVPLFLSSTHAPQPIVPPSPPTNTNNNSNKKGRPLPRERLLPEIGAFVLAGFDTSSHTIAWCLFNVAAHLEVQARIKSELGSAGLLHSGQDNCVTPRCALSLFVCLFGRAWCARVLLPPVLLYAQQRTPSPPHQPIKQPACVRRPRAPALPQRGRGRDGAARRF